jgi:hypothetical protein
MEASQGRTVHLFAMILPMSVDDLIVQGIDHEKESDASMKMRKQSLSQEICGDGPSAE